MEATLERTVRFLITESRNPHTRHLLQHPDYHDSSTQLQFLRLLLCIRSPVPALPEHVLRDIDQILLHERNHRVLTPVSSIPCLATIGQGDYPLVNIRLWKDDITTLAPGTTAITNAANSQMLGCFQPTHRCIDNVIHSWAGPRLRQECFEIASKRNQHEALSVGDAVTTQAYCLPCDFVIHTVGPELEKGSEPTDAEKQQLSQCYYSVLEEADRLPGSTEGKSIALCGISTGLFAFPAKFAAGIAIDTVAAWFAHHPSATLTDVVFVTYTEDDHVLYRTLLAQSRLTFHPPKTLGTTNPALPRCTSHTMDKARSWLASADTILVSAGAGLSAAMGLDYTSPTLFRKHFPSFLKYGLARLYDVFGFTSWPSDRVKWGYYFTHLAMVRNWPPSALYAQLIQWLDGFGENVHVRTSNADGLFLAHGWDEGRFSTPQGRYAVLQCVGNCTPESYVATAPVLAQALPHLDPITQTLKNDSAVPRCERCGGDMFICVRAADWFNEKPFAAGEARWKEFRRQVLSGSKGKTVILELGVGMNTPGVLKWPNEDLVRQGDGNVKLVRVAVGSSAEVPWDLEKEGLATSIDGDISIALPQLL
ncbi:macro domain-like protein, partial [Bimuria novae-zelandiae CBS 107.79]